MLGQVGVRAETINNVGAVFNIWPNYYYLTQYPLFHQTFWNSFKSLSSSLSNPLFLVSNETSMALRMWFSPLPSKVGYACSLAVQISQSLKIEKLVSFLLLILYKLQLFLGLYPSSPILSLSSTTSSSPIYCALQRPTHPPPFHPYFCHRSSWL